MGRLQSLLLSYPSCRITAALCSLLLILEVCCLFPSSAPPFCIPGSSLWEKSSNDHEEPRCCFWGAGSTRQLPLICRAKNKEGINVHLHSAWWADEGGSQSRQAARWTYFSAFLFILLLTGMPAGLKGSQVSVRTWAGHEVSVRFQMLRVNMRLS